jgi:hypothetical protein
VLVLASVLEAKFIIFLVGPILAINSATSELYVFATQAPVLASTSLRLVLQTVQMEVGYFETIFEEFRHVVGLNRGVLTMLTIRNV